MSLPRANRGLLPEAEGVSVDELHGEEDPLAEGADVVDGDHVGVGELRQRLRLPQDPGASLGRVGATRSTCRAGP